jgi:hypothetical protein
MHCLIYRIRRDAGSAVRVDTKGRTVFFVSGRDELDGRKLKRLREEYHFVLQSEIG